MLNKEKRSGLLDILADVDAEVARHSPRCDATGRCCRFQEFGHTLFLSQIEAELLFEQEFPAEWTFNEATCPYQHPANGQCTARERRPIGCRVYFCDPNFVDQQSDISEAFISRLKQLHRRTEANWNYRPLHHFIEDWLASRPSATPVMVTKPTAPTLPATTEIRLVDIGLLKR